MQSYFTQIKDSCKNVLKAEKGGLLHDTNINHNSLDITEGITLIP